MVSLPINGAMLVRLGTSPNLLRVALSPCDARCTSRTAARLGRHRGRSRRFVEAPVGYIINLNANYFYLRFDYFGSLGRFLRNNATKTLAFPIRLQQNTKGNENDSHYRSNNRLFVTSSEPFMIVCVCNNISDREIRQAVDLGLTSMADLYKELGVGTCCGKCVSYAREVMHEHLESKTVVTELRRTPHDGLAA